MDRERLAVSRATDYSSSAALTRLRRELTPAGIRRAALFAAYYFSDVYGQYPAALVVALALPLVLLPAGERVAYDSTSSPA